MISFDIETHKWDKFVVGGIYDNETDKYIINWDEKDYFDTINECEVVYGWNCGNYDSLWYCDLASAEGHELDFVLTGSRAVKVTNLTTGTSLIDCMGFIPMSLNRAAAVFDLPCKGQLDYEKILTIDKDEVEEYLKHDLWLTTESYSRMIAHWEQEGWLPALTLGSSLWKTLKKQIEIPSAKWRHSRDYNFTRKAYFGGRVAALKSYSKSGFCLDIVSAYPHVMASTLLPFGDYAWHDKHYTRKYFEEGLAGVIQCRVYSPRVYLPVLPVRTAKGLAYPVGEFSGVWTSDELAYAVACGYKILNYYSGIFWYERKNYLQEAIRLGFEARVRAGKDTPLGKHIKIFINSAYGKLGQRPDRWGITSTTDPDKVIFCPAPDCKGECRIGKCCIHKCYKNCGAWELLGRSNKFFRYPVYRIASCAHVQAAAFITANVRMIWHRAALACGKSLVYGDTDSLFTETIPEGLVLGDKLGDFSLECRYTNLVVGGPKLYCCDTDKDGLKIGSKGVDLNSADDFHKYLDGEPNVRDKGVVGLKTAAREGKGLFKRKRLTRVCRQPFTKGDRITTNQHESRPPHIEEIIWLQ